MRATLPKQPMNVECGIVILDTSKGSGTHWVTYYKNNNYVEYFDSFGNLQPLLEIIKHLGKIINSTHLIVDTYD